MKRPATVRRDLITVCAALVSRRHTFDLAVAIKLRTIQESLDRGTRGGKEIHPAVPLVDSGDVDDVTVELRQQALGGPIERHAIQMAPAVFLAQPRRGRPVRHFHDVVNDVHPRLIRIPDHAADCSGRRVR